MNYTKKPLTIEQQINKLKSRNLIIDDECKAADYLSNISYYRLRAYSYPFQDNHDVETDHRFVRNNIRFNEIVELYCFDRRLRSIVFNAIEKIEVAVRTKITYAYAIYSGDSHWFTNPDFFKVELPSDTNHWVGNDSKFKKLMDDIGGEIDRSNEEFIKHYKTKYTAPHIPPSWMTLEVVSFSTLSRLFKLLKRNQTKANITKEFGLKKIDILENWLHAISDLRNCCAHHTRIWNRRYVVQVIFPYDTIFPFMNRTSELNIKKNKLFAILSCIKYLLDIISPRNDFKKNLLSMASEGGSLLSMKDMGFPENWECLDVWKDK